jgi:hypothetical protein
MTRAHRATKEASSVTRTAINNAAEFGRHDKFGGWALGLLVACSVESDNGHGGDRRSDSRNDRSLKISADEFARHAGTSRPRVRRYLDAWERAAAKRVVPKASSLSPDDVDAYTLPEGYDWFDYYTAATGSGGTAIERVEVMIGKDAEAVVQKLSADSRADLLDALVARPGRTADAPRSRSLSERWERWITTINTVMMNGARLLHETEETSAELSGHARLAVLMYERLVEKKLDAELRQLLETDAS